MAQQADAGGTAFTPLAPARSVGAETVAWAIVAAMPLALAIANRSSVAVLALAALVAVAGAYFARHQLPSPLAALTTRLRGLVASPGGVVLCLWLGLCLISLLWTHDRSRALFVFLEGAIPVLLTAVLLAALPRPPVRWVVVAFAALFAISCVELFVEFETKLLWRHLMGLRTAPFGLNKPVIALVLLYWPLLALSRDLPGRKPALIGLALLMAATVFKSVSGAAMLGMVVAGGVFWLAGKAPAACRRLLMAAMLAALAIAPFKGEIASHMIPASMLDRLESVHALDRVHIWQSFGEVVQRRWLLGTGFGSSAAMARDPVAQEVPPERQRLLDVGHPHDMFLQIWTELGLLGAALAATAILLLWRQLARLPGGMLPPVLATLAAAFVIAEVGHGIWQGWWVAIIGAAVLWFRSALPPSSAPVFSTDAKDQPR